MMIFVRMCMRMYVHVHIHRDTCMCKDMHKDNFM